MTAVDFSLACVAVLLALGPLGAVRGRTAAAPAIIYTACLTVSVTACGNALYYLLTAASTPVTDTLPLGLPVTGAHFRLDALSALFLVVANLGIAAASLYAL